MPRRYEERIRDQASDHDTNTVYGQSQAQSPQQLFLPLALSELFDRCVFLVALNVRFSPEVHIIIVGLLQLLLLWAIWVTDLVVKQTWENEADAGTASAANIGEDCCE